MQKQFATVAGWQRISNVSRAAIYRLVNSGRLVAHKQGRSIMIDVQEGLKYVKSTPKVGGIFCFYPADVLALMALHHTDNDEEIALRTYLSRKNRASNPDGVFDNAKRWLPSAIEECPCCVGLARPTRAQPYTLMQHCRTVKHCAELLAVDVADVQSAIKRVKIGIDSQSIDACRFRLALLLDNDGLAMETFETGLVGREHFTIRMLHDDMSFLQQVCKFASGPVATELKVFCRIKYPSLEIKM